MEKTVNEIIEEVKCEICDKYCRYQCEIEDEEELFKFYCENCPLGRL